MYCENRGDSLKAIRTLKPNELITLSDPCMYSKYLTVVDGEDKDMLIVSEMTCDRK